MKNMILEINNLIQEFNSRQNIVKTKQKKSIHGQEKPHKISILQHTKQKNGRKAHYKKN